MLATRLLDATMVVLHDERESSMSSQRADRGDPCTRCPGACDTFAPPRPAARAKRATPLRIPRHHGHSMRTGGRLSQGLDGTRCGSIEVVVDASQGATSWEGMMTALRKGLGGRKFG